MKNLFMKIIAALAFNLAALLPAGLAESILPATAYAQSGFDWGYTLICVVAFASLVWLYATTYRRTRVR